MSNIDGSWKTETSSPMGDQEGVLTVMTSGTTVTGNWVNPMGTSEIKDGHVTGDTLTWKTDILVPMPMTLDCKATVTGNTMSGTVTAGAFGTFPLTGTREA
jgi:hypothetical protein